MPTQQQKKAKELTEEIQKLQTRRSKEHEVGDTIVILRASAPHCAKYLRDVILMKIKKPSWARIEVCKYILDHELGKARIKAEISGAGGVPLSWQMVVLLAKEAEESGETSPGLLKAGNSNVLDLSEEKGKEKGKPVVLDSSHFCQEDRGFEPSEIAQEMKKVRQSKEL